MQVNESRRRKLKNRLLSGSIWAVIGKALAAATGLLVNAILARLIAPSDMGYYFLIISFVTAAVLVIQFGSQQIVVRSIAAALVGQDSHKEPSVVIWSVMRFGFINALVVSSILILVGMIVPAREMIGISIVSVLLVSFFVFGRAVLGLIVESFRGLHDIRNASIFNLGAANLLTLIGLVIYWRVQSNASLEEVLLVTSIATFLSLIGAWMILRKRLRPRRESAVLGARHFIVNGAPLFITSMSIFLFTQADLWVVGTMIGADAAGLYGAVVRLIQLIFIPLLITNAVLPPIISELWAQGRIQQIERVMRGMGTAAGIPAIIVLAVFAIWSADILRLVYGEFYTAGSTALVIVSIGYIFNVLSGSAQILLIMAGYDKVTMAINVGFGALMVVSLLIVAPIYGMNGVAAVTGATVALQAATTWYMAKRVAGVYTHFGIRHLKPALSAVLRRNAPEPE